MSCTISTTYDCSIIFTGTYVLFIKSGKKIQYTHIYFQLNVCMCFHFKVFWWYFNIFNRPKCPNPKLLWPQSNNSPATIYSFFSLPTNFLMFPQFILTLTLALEDTSRCVPHSLSIFLLFIIWINNYQCT